MLVMWVLTLLTVMAVGLTAAQRTEVALTDNHVETVRFRLLADAALAYAALNFMTQPSETDAEVTTAETGTAVWLPNGAPHSWWFAGTDLRISVFNEMSRINLNQAEPELLESLLRALDVPEDEANALSSAITDWRDDDDLARLNGAEDGDYKQAGLAFGAKDEPFVAVEELRQVLGMTPDIYRRLAPEVTVENEGGALAEEFASPAVLAATQGISLEAAREQIAERDQTTVPGSVGPRTLDRGGPLYRILVREGSSDRQGRRMEAMVEVMPGQQPPYLVRWRRFGLGPERSADPEVNDG